jgi:hypothetical protein
MKEYPWIDICNSTCCLQDLAMPHVDRPVYHFPNRVDVVLVNFQAAPAWESSTICFLNTNLAVMPGESGENECKPWKIKKEGLYYLRLTCICSSGVSWL